MIDRPRPRRTLFQNRHCPSGAVPARRDRSNVRRCTVDVWPALLCIAARSRCLAARARRSLLLLFRASRATTRATIVSRATPEKVVERFPARGRVLARDFGVAATHIVFPRCASFPAPSAAGLLSKKIPAEIVLERSKCGVRMHFDEKRTKSVHLNGCDGVSGTLCATSEIIPVFWLTFALVVPSL